MFYRDPQRSFTSLDLANKLFTDLAARRNTQDQ